MEKERMKICVPNLRFLLSEITYVTAAFSWANFVKSSLIVFLRASTSFNICCFFSNDSSGFFKVSIIWSNNFFLALIRSVLFFVIVLFAKRSGLATFFLAASDLSNSNFARLSSAFFCSAFLCSSFFFSSSAFRSSK